MSRIGLKAIEIPQGVSFEENNGILTVKGPKGTLTVKIPNNISYEIKDNHITFARANEEKQTKQSHGTTRALVQNAVTGVSAGYTKKLEIVGIGYRAQMRGTSLVLNMGYSHEVVITPDQGVTITAPDALKIEVSGIDRQAVGQTAARIRAVREPEPYKGKGIHYVGEHILRKEGKRAAASGKK